MHIYFTRAAVDLRPVDQNHRRSQTEKPDVRAFACGQQAAKRDDVETELDHYTLRFRGGVRVFHSAAVCAVAVQSPHAGPLRSVDAQPSGSIFHDPQKGQGSRAPSSLYIRSPHKVALETLGSPSNTAPRSIPR